MEVHHHTHTDPALGGTTRKKFTHYLPTWLSQSECRSEGVGIWAENKKRI
jgi:hypothetical protein